MRARCPSPGRLRPGPRAARSARPGGPAAARTPPPPASPAGRCPALAAAGRKRCPHSTSGRRGAKSLAAAAAARVGAAGSGRGAAPAPAPPRLEVTHVESGVLGAEEREGHGERPQPRAAVVLLGGDSVAALRAERVEVGEGHRAAHPAHAEPQGRGQEQRPGGAAQHRRGSAGGTQRHTAGPEPGRGGTQRGPTRGRGGDGAGTKRGHCGGPSRDGVGTQWGQSGARRGQSRTRQGQSRAKRGPRGLAVRAGLEPAGPEAVREARRAVWELPRARPGGPRVAAPPGKAPGGTAFRAGPAPGAAA